MAFRDRTQTGNFALLRWVHIAGIPYIFADGPIPSSWDTGSGVATFGGESYTWSATYMSGGQSRGSKMQIKSGIAEGGGMSFDFRLGGTNTSEAHLWQSLIAGSIDRSDADHATLLETLTAYATTATLSGLSSWASSGTAYFGRETVSYSGKTATTLTGLTRQLFGSSPTQHSAEFGPLDVGAGGFVSTIPLVWRGRVVTMHLEPGEIVDGVFRPFSSAPGGADSQIGFRGYISQAKPTGDLTVGLAASPLSSAFQRTIGRGLPTVSPKTRAQLYGRTHFAPDAGHIDWVWSWAEASGVYSPGQIRGAAFRMQDYRDSADLDEGLFSEVEIGRHVVFTMTDGVTKPDWAIAGDGWLTLQLLTTVDRKWRLRAKCHYVAFANPDAWLSIDATPAGSFWRQLGFSGVVTAQAEEHPDGYWLFTLDAEDEAPAFYLPATRTSPRKIYVDWLTPGAQALNPEVTAEDASTVDCALRIGTEVVRYSSTGADSEGGTYVQLSARGSYGSQLQEHILTEEDADTSFPTGVGFAGVSPLRIALYCLLGGVTAGAVNPSAYNIDPVGAFAGIDADFVDVDGIEDLGDDLSTTYDNFVLFGETTLADLLGSIGLHMGLVFGDGLDDSGDWTIRAFLSLPPLESESSDAFALSDSNTMRFAGGGSSVDADESRILNVIRIDSKWDHGSDQAGQNVTASQATSIATWGVQQTMSIELKGVSGASDFAEDFAAQIFGAFSRPYAIASRTLSSSEWWSVPVGSVVDITDDRELRLAVPGSVFVPGRGLSMRGRILEHVAQYPDLDGGEQQEPRGKATIMLTGGANRVSTWAPSLLVTSIVGGDLICAIDVFEKDGRGLSSFYDGQSVRLVKPGDGAASESRTIDSVKATSITLTAGPTMSAPFFVEVEPYGAGDDDDHTHLASDSEEVGAGDPPFRYV